MKTKDIKEMEVAMTNMSRDMNASTRRYQTATENLFACGETLKTELNEKDVVTKCKWTSFTFRHNTRRIH